MSDTPHTISLADIAALTSARLAGTPDLIISGVSAFDDAGPKDLTFAGDAKFLAKLAGTEAGAVLVPETYEETPPGHLNLLYSSNPKLDFFKVVEHLFPTPELTEHIDASAVIGKDARIGNGTCIGPNAVIGDHAVIGKHVHIMANAVIGNHCRIGDGTIIKPNATIMDRSVLGRGVLIHPGAVIGSDGYGFTQDGSIHAKQVHTGFVEIGDHAEVGACTTIDRGTLGVTRIGAGVKIDNQVHIAHNVKIGDNSLVVAQVGIAGSTTIGKGVILAGKVGVSGHLTIGNNVIVGPYAGVSASIPDNEVVSGIPHMPHKIWLKVASTISRLPGMRSKIMRIEKRLRRLEEKP